MVPLAPGAVDSPNLPEGFRGPKAQQKDAASRVLGSPIEYGVLPIICRAARPSQRGSLRKLRWTRKGGFGA